MLLPLYNFILHKPTAKITAKDCFALATSPSCALIYLLHYFKELFLFVALFLLYLQQTNKITSKLFYKNCSYLLFSFANLQIITKQTNKKL